MEDLTLDEFIKINYNKFLRFAFSFVRDNEKAKDLVQDACVRVIEAQYDKITISLFYLVIRNLFINYYRKDRHDTFYKSEYIKKVNHNYNIQNFEEKELIQNIFDQDDELSYFAKGYKYREIAQMFRTSIGTIKSRIHFRRKDIKNILDQDIMYKFDL